MQISQVGPASAATSTIGIGSNKPVPESTPINGVELPPLTKKEIAKRKEERLAQLKLTNTLCVGPLLSR